MQRLQILFFRGVLMIGILFIHIIWGTAQEQKEIRTYTSKNTDINNPLWSLSILNYSPFYSDNKISSVQPLSPLPPGQPGSQFSIQSRWDTVGIELITVPTLIESDGGGYISGNNSYGDLAKANFISEPFANSFIIGVMLWFGYATGDSESQIEVAIWNDSDGPYEQLASESISLGEVMVDVFFDNMTYVEFSSPIPHPGPYYVGIMLPVSGEADTVALYSSRSDDLTKGNAWEMWSNGSWCPVSDPTSWKLELTFGIFPIEYTPTSVNEHEAAGTKLFYDVYPNPASGPFIIELNKQVTGLIRLQMYNITGNKVYNEILDNSRNPRHIEVNPGRLPKGIYIIRLSAGKELGTRSLMVF
jgi:hypothetical protein